MAKQCDADHFMQRNGGAKPSTSTKRSDIKGVDKMELRNTLRALRKSKKMTLHEASESIGVSLNTVYRWEHGEAAPTRSRMNDVAAAYGVTVDYLRHGDGKATVLSDREQQLIDKYKMLSKENQLVAIGYIDRMLVER